MSVGEWWLVGMCQSLQKGQSDPFIVVVGPAADVSPEGSGVPICGFEVAEECLEFCYAARVIGFDIELDSCIVGRGGLAEGVFEVVYFVVA